MNEPDPKQALIAQLEKPPKCSKKYRIVVIGIGVVSAFFVIAIAALLFAKVEQATFIASVYQFSVTAIGGMVSVYAGSTAAVEWKTTESLGKQ